jgi:hypothetical protein
MAACDRKLTCAKFVYVFAVAGALLILMNILYIISRMGKGRWGFWNYLKTAIVFLLGLGLALVALLGLNDDDAALYYSTPWIIPTMLLTYFVVLVISHIPHPPALIVGRNKMARSEEDGMGRTTGAAHGGDYAPVQREGSPSAGTHGMTGNHGQDYLKTPQPYESQYTGRSSAEEERARNNPSPLSNA